jgi:hypothetical protein
MGEPLKIFKDSVEAKMKIRFPYWDGVGEEKEEKQIGGISWITDYQSFKTEMDKEIGIFMGDCPEAIKAQCDKKIEAVFDENKKQYNSFLNLYHRPVPTHKEIQQQSVRVMAFGPENQHKKHRKKNKTIRKATLKQQFLEDGKNSSLAGSVSRVKSQHLLRKNLLADIRGHTPGGNKRKSNRKTRKTRKSNRKSNRKTRKSRRKRKTRKSRRKRKTHRR